MKRFPWARAMEIGLGHLRLAPRDFWRMTLPELAAASGAMPLPDPHSPTRVEFDALLERFPDQRQEP
jgi:uncharacterized phage protein (TIGR02216 family)